MTEEEAIRRLQGGDISGLRVVVEKYELKAVRAAVLVTRDRGLAEEVVQEAFVRVYQRIGQFDDSRPFGPWFLRIVINDALKVLRRQKREVHLDGADGERVLGHMLPDVAPGLEEQVDRAELRQRVREALVQLSPKQRAAIVLRYYLDMGGAEMAEVLGITEGAVKWRLAAARERLGILLRSEQTEVE